MIDYGYDSLSRQTSETWYDDVTDADAQQNVRKTYATTYDDAGRIATIGDGEYDFAYTWSIFGNLTSTTQDLTGLADDVVFSYAYDVFGRKTSVSAAIGSNEDYVNTYSYDNLGRITQITQDGVLGGNAVAEKRVDFGYSDDGTRATISRSADLAGTKPVAETEQIFDQLGRLTDIVHARAGTEFAGYDLAWDAAGRISDFDFDSLVGDDGTGNYSYDDTNQLTGADYDFQTDEAYTYDSNGNRTITGYATGDHNRLTSDGTWNYTYDGEGNVLTKTNISTSESAEYTWDHRNRLVKVTIKSSGGAPTKIVEYAYDHGQRWVRKTLDTNADGTIEQSQVFVHDDGQIVLDFQKTGTSAASNSDLAHRYLWGNSVDQLLADEAVDDGSEDDTAWPLTDHLNSVRDMVVYDPITGTVSVVKHVTFDAFGNVTSDNDPAVLTLFRYTARPFDAETGIQNNLNRWYDLSTGRWMSVDRIGFEAGDVNLYRYVHNASSHRIDPDGLLEIKIEYYDVKGSYQDVYRQQGFPFLSDGPRHHASVVAVLNHRILEVTKDWIPIVQIDPWFLCLFLGRLRAKLEFYIEEPVVVTLPRWVDLEDKNSETEITQKEKQAWLTYLNALKNHEEEHINIAKKYAGPVAIDEWRIFPCLFGLGRRLFDAWAERVVDAVVVARKLNYHRAQLRVDDVYTQQAWPIRAILVPPEIVNEI